MLNERFTSYFQDTFFQNKEDEFKQFLHAIEQSIPRTIRIKPSHEESVKKHLESDGWILTKTVVPRVYSMDRREDFDPLERRLGFSLDHVVGNFYIQELAAAHPVDILADGTIHDDEFLILDMASSPWGKTTQLAEYYPNSFIIANEPTRERIPQLLQNLHRMGTPNVGITLYPGQYWKNYSETFDRILLDAPCSGEWTLYKWTDAVRHWHLRNIKDIAKLQTKLLDASLHALKVGGEMIYSTCSLNLLENEWVLDSMRERYGQSFKVTYEKKFWPHIDGTGGFFVAKIRKIAALEGENRGERRWTWNEKLIKYRWSLSTWDIQEDIKLYEHDKKILAVKNPPSGLDDIYLMRFWEQIGSIENWRFEPSMWSSRYLDTTGVERYEIWDENLLDEYLRGSPMPSEWKDWYILISYKWETLWLEYRKDTIIQNTFPKDWRRR